MLTARQTHAYVAARYVDPALPRVGRSGESRAVPISFCEGFDNGMSTPITDFLDAYMERLDKPRSREAEQPAEVSSVDADRRKPRRLGWLWSDPASAKQAAVRDFKRNRFTTVEAPPVKDEQYMVIRIKRSTTDDWIPQFGLTGCLTDGGEVEFFVLARLDVILSYGETIKGMGGDLFNMRWSLCRPRNDENHGKEYFTFYLEEELPVKAEKRQEYRAMLSDGRVESCLRYDSLVRRDLRCKPVIPEDTGMVLEHGENLHAIIEDCLWKQRVREVHATNFSIEKMLEWLENPPPPDEDGNPPPVPTKLKRFVKMPGTQAERIAAFLASNPVQADVKRVKAVILPFSAISVCSGPAPEDKPFGCCTDCKLFGGHNQFVDPYLLRAVLSGTGDSLSVVVPYTLTGLASTPPACEKIPGQDLRLFCC